MRVHLFLIVGLCSNALSALDLPTVENQIQAGRQQGLVYQQNNKDDRAKKSASSALEDAEKKLNSEAKDNPSCEKCHELLALSLFYQSYFGFEKNYEKFDKQAELASSKFPQNARVLTVRGYAAYYRQDYGGALRFLKQALPTAPADTAGSIRQIMDEANKNFLGNWNHQANFYQSKESRVERNNPQTWKPEVIYQVTPQIELNLGQQGFTAMTSNKPTVSDPEIQGYVERLVARLLGGSPGSPFQYQVTILNSNEVNAVTTPGHVLVYTGLLQFTETEGQLAGVLAHELAHNYGHHQARAVVKQMMVQNAANAIVQAFNPQGAAAAGAALGSSVAMTLFSRAYSRFEEKEADLYGTHIMYNGGYNPADAAGFFLKMQSRGGKDPVKFLSTHPPSLDRAGYVSDYVENFPFEGKEFRSDSEEFQKIRARLTGGGAQTRPGSGGAALPPL